MNTDLCPSCENPHGMAADVIDADCPHCGAWLVRRGNGPMVLRNPEREPAPDYEGDEADRRYDAEVARELTVF